MGRRHTVLVVDDDDAVRALLRDVLDEAGHQVLVARDGDEALATLRGSFLPCVVLTDVRMPRMDGWELSKAMARDPELASVPVVTLTGDRVLSFTSPARDKPFALEELDALVQRTCVLHRTHGAPGGARAVS